MAAILGTVGVIVKSMNTNTRTQREILEAVRRGVTTHQENAKTLTAIGTAMETEYREARVARTMAITQHTDLLAAVERTAGALTVLTVQQPAGGRRRSKKANEEDCDDGN